MNNTEKYHTVNGIAVDQRMSDGFINATAMCRSQGKRIHDWLRLNSTIELIQALADDLGIESTNGNSRLHSGDTIHKIYPTLVVVKRQTFKDGGGTWLHPDLAIQLAQWCSPVFAIQVSRWVREWIQASQNSQGYDSDTDFKNAVRDEIRSLKGEVKRLVNLKLAASKEHPGLGELIDSYGEDDYDVPLSLPNPFTYTQWALATGFENTGGNLRRRIAESVKALRKTKQLKSAKNGHKLYYHSDLPAFKAVLENIQGSRGKVADLRKYQAL